MQSVLEQIAAKSGGKIKTGINPGEGAFYGPKFEYVLRDAIGRDWQCGTIQVDFFLPERFGAFYIDADGEKKTPVMIHRAMFGSMERFAGILLENTAGHLPLWLAPVQVKVCTIVSDADGYAEEVLAALKKTGLRAEIDTRNEKINYKVREHSLAKVPVMLVVGKREAEEKTVSVRRMGVQQQQVMALAEAVRVLADEAVPPDLKEASGRGSHGRLTRTYSAGCLRCARRGRSGRKRLSSVLSAFNPICQRPARSQYSLSRKSSRNNCVFLTHPRRPAAWLTRG